MEALVLTTPVVPSIDRNMRTQNTAAISSRDGASNFAQPVPSPPTSKNRPGEQRRESIESRTLSGPSYVGVADPVTLLCGVDSLHLSSQLRSRCLVRHVADVKAWRRKMADTRSSRTCRHPRGHHGSEERELVGGSDIPGRGVASPSSCLPHFPPLRTAIAAKLPTWGMRIRGENVGKV